MAQTVYIETSIVSYLAARPSRDVMVAAWQQATHEWWQNARPTYELFASILVRDEAGRGDPVVSRARLALLADIPDLVVTPESRRLGEYLLACGGVPSAAGVDALHIAIASVYDMDYLLTWNCRHIGNANAMPRLRSLLEAEGYRCPEICTPMHLRGPDE